MMQLEEMEKAILDLQVQVRELREWSDTNDYMLQEMINNLTKYVNQATGISEEDVGGPYTCQRE